MVPFGFDVTVPCCGLAENAVNASPSGSEHGFAFVSEWPGKVAAVIASQLGGAAWAAAGKSIRTPIAAQVPSARVESPPYRRSELDIDALRSSGSWAPTLSPPSRGCKAIGVDTATVVLLPDCGRPRDVARTMRRPRGLSACRPR